MAHALPLPRLGSLALHDAASAAGYAMACPYETSEQVHAEAVSFWKQRRRVQSWRAVPQRLMTVCAALLVVF